MKHLGNGEGFTTLILTDAESRLIRKALDDHPDVAGPLSSAPGCRAVQAFNAGIQRATDRIKAEFDQEQKRRKESK